MISTFSKIKLSLGMAAKEATVEQRFEEIRKVYSEIEHLADQLKKLSSEGNEREHSIVSFHLSKKSLYLKYLLDDMVLLSAMEIKK